MGVPLCFFQITSRTKDQKCSKRLVNFRIILTGLIALLTTCYLMKNIQDMFGENGAVIGTFTSVIVKIEMKYVTNGTMHCILFALYVLLVLTILTQTYLHRLTTKEQKSKLEEESTSVSSQSLFSKLTFGYCTKLVIKGYRQKLDKKDLFPLNEEETSACVVPRFEKYWNQEVDYIKRSCVVSTTKKAGKGNEELKQQPRLVKCLLTAFGPYVLGAAMLNLLSSIFGLLTPFVLRLLIQFTEDHKNAMWKGYMYAILMFGLTIGRTIFETQQGLKNCSGERRMWIAISSVIYKKTLRLSNSAKKSSTSGEIANLLSVDAGRISTCFHNINFLWTIPFMFCATLFLLWQTLGVSAFIGLGIVVVLIPFNSYLVKKGKDLHLEVMDLKDNRVKMMNEVLNGIKVLKLYAWEDSFEKQISTIRDKEMGVIRNQALVGTCMHLAWCLTPFLVSLGTFAMYVLIDPENVLTAEKAFVAMSLFGMLSWNLNALPHIVNHYVQANVALKRIQTFLNKEELNEEAVTRNHDNKNAVTVDSGTFAWNKEDDFMLKDINVHIPEGSFVAIVGSVGSGKSSMLSAILGEMESMSGKVNLKGSVAYVSQQAWIRNASLQNNILFGKGMDKREYNDIINATALRTDLDVLSGGDQTEIGEKGINLSGGQKQRVSLARALYQDADIYLLDDPLSAVDAHVGKHIFDEVLDKKGKLGKKTRILVTNGVSFLPKTDMIITMVDGKIGEMGTFKELIDHKGAFAEFLDNYMINKGSDKEETLSERNEISGLSETKDENSKTVKTKDDIKETDNKTVDKIIDDESNESGKARSAVMSFYMSAIGVPLSVFIVIFNIAFEILSRSSDVWISQWTSDNTTHINGTVDTTQRNMRLGVYAGIGALQGFVLLLVGYGVSTARMNASRKLHKNLLRNILRSPMTFFDTTPVGRIVNRFSNDVARIDNEIIYQFKDCIISAAVVICNSVIICFGTPQFLCVLLPITILYFILQRFYTVTSTQLRRFETSANSPIYSQFAETISGTSTIRAYNQQGRFIDESAERIDAHKTAQNSAGVVSRWLSIRLQFMGALILLFVCIFAVLEKATLFAGIVGLVITYALEITGCLQWVVRVISDLENNTVSIEKIQEYTETPTEAAWEIPEKQPSSSWPEIGCIEFQDYGVRYREGLDLVLKGITCKIQPNEKIGIVGRTGAGKSSLTMALFRILEKAKGKIIIDGTDISTIGLHDLRSKITIIPQDPVLFSGTMRMNLDPFEEYSNKEIWKALEHAHLKKFVDGLDEGLDFKCSEGGENFSVGQRQLMCLARALLRKTKILVLDEATAAVDLETDDLIQNTIRTEFSDCTILTIAHRLNTIMDYTRIMVLDAGNISEFDTPSHLLDNCESMFYGMAKDAGLVKINE
ncbi:multidrug resistance-associated protein 1-like [Mytilus edulis]|uniref:multidrug resistance-associated protein 1-like n=1 Tax=Mytilus edulis TaxID=6550 RepID=UPI0039F024BE